MQPRCGSLRNCYLRLLSIAGVRCIQAAGSLAGGERWRVWVVAPVVGGGEEGVPLIRTPDQRVRVFVSSTLSELAAERAAARSAIRRLHLTPVMFELGARPHAPRELYRAYLAQSEVFVGIYWQQSGWVAPGEEVSGLEDEYLLSGAKPKLIYVKAAADRQPRLTEMLSRIEADDRASYKHFGEADDLAELLADDLAVLLTERFVQPLPAAAPDRRSVPLPVPLTSIIGREDEIAALVALLRDPDVHLVTLIGPGGIGKTRLAIEVARKMAATVPADLDGVSFIDLASVRDAAGWPEAVTAVLGIQPEGTRPVLDLLIDRVQGQRLLLVLDNVEQLVAAASDLGALLAACPDLTVLATSRIVLRLRGEHEVALAPLPTPRVGPEADAAAIERSAAVRLLVARARQVRPDFAVTSDNAAAVAELSRRLDGIPLALELAAAQLRLLTPATLLRRLGAGLDRSLDLAASTVDTPDRQRTLRATIQWSYSLLGEAERALLARLSVFTGSWTVEASEAVGTVAGDLDAIDTLASLLAQSLILIDESDPAEPCFRMLNTIQLFAREQLADRGETDATISRLTRYLIQVAETVRGTLQGPEHHAASERLDRERDEIRSAIDWALRTDDAETVAQLLTSLFIYWWSRGLLPTTHELAEQAAALPSAASLPPHSSAFLLAARGMSALMIGRPTEAEPLMLRALEAANSLEDRRLQAYALLGLGGALVHRAVGEACQRLDEATEAFRDLDDRWGLALTLSTRGQLALLAGDGAAAQRMHEEALTAARAIDNQQLQAQILDMLGLDAATGGDVITARDHYAAAAELHIRLLDYEGSSYGLSGLAGLALAQGRASAAARLIGASDYARKVIGTVIWPGMQATTDDLVAAVAAALGSATFAAAAAAGARLRIPDAFGYGLAATGEQAASDPFPDWASRLRPAETVTSGPPGRLTLVSHDRGQPALGARRRLRCASVRRT
jgi:predicted ATPase